jgi:hypothetical protein
MVVINTPDSGRYGIAAESNLYTLSMGVFTITAAHNVL